jgi:hypothetical protein
MNAVLKGFATETRGEAARSHESSHSREGLIAYGGIGTKSQFERHALERFTSDAARQRLNFDYTVHSGCRAYAPPYDREYQVGTAEAFGATADGNVMTLAPYDGQSAAGIGFYLTTDEPVLASITPQGTYQWSWFNLQNVLPNVWTTGGTGITIYANSDTEPTLSRQQVLWSASGLTPWSGHTDNGNIADAASPAFGFGSVPLGPAHGSWVAIPCLDMVLATGTLRRERRIPGSAQFHHAVGHRLRWPANFNSLNESPPAQTTRPALF